MQYIKRSGAPRFATVQPILPSRLFHAPVGSDFAAHEAIWGEPPAGVDLIGELHRSGLTGRGGAGFPAASKVAALEAAPRMIVGNASEGEPLSAKDAALLRDAPHLVLDGLRALGDALSPRAPLVLVTHPRSFEAAASACAARPDRSRFQLREQRDAFVAGEATAAASRARGERGAPSDHRYRLTSAASRGGPVLLFNAETLAHIALISRFGSDWFRGVGTATDPGTRLFTVATETGLHGVVELPGGSTLRTVLGAGGLEPRDTTAVLVGGYHGVWMTAESLDRPLTAGREPDALAAGAGVLLAVQGSVCPLQLTADIVAYLAAESAQQCGPCTLGLPRLSHQMQAIVQGDHSAVERLEQQGQMITGRGACRHPDGTVRVARSAARAFATEVVAHAAGVCRMSNAA